jgi:hypothetical protein
MNTENIFGRNCQVTDRIFLSEKNNQQKELSDGDCEVIQFFREYLASNL